MMLDSIKIDFVGRSMGVSGLRRARVCVMFHFNLDVRKMFYSHLVKPKRITEYHNVFFFVEIRKLAGGRENTRLYLSAHIPRLIMIR